MLRAGPALARVEVGMPLGLPESIAQDRSPGLQLPTPRGTTGFRVASSDNLRGHHCGVGLFLRHPPHALHLALRLSDEQVGPDCD